MSEEGTVDPKQPVSFAALDVILKNITDQFNDAFKKRDEHIEARFNQFADLLKQIADRAQDKSPGVEGAINKNDLIQKVVDKVIAKVSGEEDDPANDVDFQQYKRNIHALYNLGIKRAIQATDVLIKKELKMPTASNMIAEKMITEDLGHGPA